MFPLAANLLIVFVVGAFLGTLVNWAVYTLAWTPRLISPWSPAPGGAAPRNWADRIPILGWRRLNREAKFFGPRFWVRPMLLEFGLGVGLAALYWWEIGQFGLVRGQSPIAIVPPLGPLHWQFFSHVVLICLLLAASMIDIDERFVPDDITVPGTVLGLILATLVPISLLPDVAERIAPPSVGVSLQGPAGTPAAGPNGDWLFLEPITFISPNVWPPAWGDPQRWSSLAIALGCYLLWCFAIVPRIWRRSRGAAFALRMILARVVREFTRPPLRWFVIGGAFWITCTWVAARLWPNFGVAAWCGLLTSLVGLVGGGGIVWAVRIVGSASLRREAMGFGDVTLMMMVGTFLGWQACLVTFFLSPFAAVVVGIIQLILRRDDALPFVPYLCLGAVATVVAWAATWAWAEAVFEHPELVVAALVICLMMLGAMLTLWRNIKEWIFGGRS